MLVADVLSPIIAVLSQVHSRGQSYGESRLLLSHLEFDAGSGSWLPSQTDGEYDNDTCDATAPETVLLTRSESHSRYPAPDRRAADVWAVGCLVGYLVTGRPLFVAVSGGTSLLQSIAAVLGQPSSRDLWFASPGAVPGSVLPTSQDRSARGGAASQLVSVLPASLSLDCVDFLTSCLVWDPDRRMSAAAAAHHPFLSDGTTVVHPRVSFGFHEPPQVLPPRAGAGAGGGRARSTVSAVVGSYVYKYVFERDGVGYTVTAKPVPGTAVDPGAVPPPPPPPPSMSVSFSSPSRGRSRRRHSPSRLSLDTTSVVSLQPSPRHFSGVSVATSPLADAPPSPPSATRPTFSSLRHSGVPVRRAKHTVARETVAAAADKQRRSVSFEVAPKPRGRSHSRSRSRSRYRSPRRSRSPTKGTPTRRGRSPTVLTSSRRKGRSPTRSRSRSRSRSAARRRSPSRSLSPSRRRGKAAVPTQVSRSPSPPPPPPKPVRVLHGHVRVSRSPSPSPPPASPPRSVLSSGCSVCSDVSLPPPPPTRPRSPSPPPPPASPTKNVLEVSIQQLDLLETAYSGLGVPRRDVSSRRMYPGPDPINDIGMVLSAAVPVPGPRKPRGSRKGDKLVYTLTTTTTYPIQSSQSSPGTSPTNRRTRKFVFGFSAGVPMKQSVCKKLCRDTTLRLKLKARLPTARRGRPQTVELGAADVNLGGLARGLQSLDGWYEVHSRRHSTPIGFVKLCVSTRHPLRPAPRYITWSAPVSPTASARSGNNRDWQDLSPQSDRSRASSPLRSPSSRSRSRSRSASPPRSPSPSPPPPSPPPSPPARYRSSSVLSSMSRPDSPSRLLLGLPSPSRSRSPTRGARSPATSRSPSPTDSPARSPRLVRPPPPAAVTVPSPPRAFMRGKECTGHHHATDMQRAQRNREAYLASRVARSRSPPRRRTDAAELDNTRPPWHVGTTPGSPSGRSPSVGTSSPTADAVFHSFLNRTFGSPPPPSPTPRRRGSPLAAAHPSPGPSPPPSLRSRGSIARVFDEQTRLTAHLKSLLME